MIDFDALVLQPGFRVFGRAASYTPPGGGPAVSCSVILDSSDRELGGLAGRPMLQGRSLMVRRAELPAPAKGGTFLLSGETLVIQDDPVATDADRLLWRCTVG